MRIATFCLAALALVVPAGTVHGGLIYNGDFELGNVGFTTQYTYSVDDVSKPRTIVVGIDPHRYFSRAASYGDHSSGFGRMLIANGAEQDDVIVWEQTVSVTPNTQYVFCYWLSNWTDNDIRLAEIKCLINGTNVGIGWAPAAVGQWIFVFHRWNSGSNSQATIRLIDRSRAEVSNDFAIDDIDMFDIGDNYVLVAYSTAGGRVTSPGEGVYIYSPGEQVTLEAKCDPGYEFAGWGGNFSDPGHVLWIDMSSDRTAIAQFKKLDYNVNIQASGSAPNEFVTCAEPADRLAVFQGALDSLYPTGLVVGQRKGVCAATYRFPILKTKAGVRDITKIVVNVYGTALSGTPAAKVAGSGFYKPFQGDLHQTFTGKTIADLLRDSDGPVYWLPVEVDAVTQAWDVAGVYVSYDCASIPRSLLRRFHDHFSIYQALDGYANAQDIRDLFNRRANHKAAWEAIVQTSALAQDLGGYSDTLPSAIGVCIEGLDKFLARWQSLADSPDLKGLDGCGSETIVTCLDRAVSSGQSYIAAYAAAIADGRVLRDEASQLNRIAADWKADMAALNQAMSEVFRTLGEAYLTASDPQLGDTIEKMIRAMTPWRTGEPDDFGVWLPADPTYLDEIIRSLTDFPAEDVFVP
jgi:hypothetical protein